MNYFSIKNNFVFNLEQYTDTSKIYYVNDNNFLIIFNDSTSLLSVNLTVKIFDFDNTEYFEIIDLNNENDLYTTNIKLYEEDDISKWLIPRFIKSREKMKIIQNKYELIYDSLFSDDFHYVIYYIDNHKCRIIVRRLDSIDGWGQNLKILLYNDERSIKEFINIGPSEKNYLIIERDTKIKLLYKDSLYKQNIPKIIFQTGTNINFKNILHYNSIMTFVELNPEYEYRYFNDYDSRKFLRDNFSEEINNAYDLLVPGAFKADLLRYCYLYINGGCYFDCKQILRVPINNFLDESKTFVICNDVIEEALLNAVIFSTKKNSIIEKTIKDCVYNIINKLGNTALEVSGPIFFYKSISMFINKDNLLLQNCRPPNDFDDFNMDYINNNIKLIENDDVIINRFYKGYYNNYLETNHYGKLFDNNEVYYKNIVLSDKYKILVYPNNFEYVFNFFIKDEYLRIKRIDSSMGWENEIKILIINEENYNESFLIINRSEKNEKIIRL